MLNLRNIENATDEDKANELDVWARLFKAGTNKERIYSVNPLLSKISEDIFDPLSLIN